MKTELAPLIRLLFALAVAVLISLACGNIGNLPRESTPHVTVVPGGVMNPNATLDAAWGGPKSTQGPTRTLAWSDRWDISLCSMLESVSYEFVIKDQFTIRDGGFFCSNELHVSNTSPDNTISVYYLSMDNDGSAPIWNGIEPLGPEEINTDSIIGFASLNPAIQPSESQILLVQLVAVLDVQQCSWISAEHAYDQLTAYILDQPCKLP